MEIIQFGQKSFLKFNNLTQAGVFHFSSTKEGWNGTPRFTGDTPTDYETYRLELANAFSMNVSDFIFPRQVHGNHVFLVDEVNTVAAIPETDALITNLPGICICVQSADCAPILLYDPVQNVAAAIHAGWKGTVQKIVSKTVFEMQRLFACLPEDLLASIGPSIHMHAYEVGQDVIAKVQNNFEDYRYLLKPSNQKDKAFFDLWEANRSLLVQVGLKNENIETIGFCNFSHPDLFFSARRDGTNTGRMVTGIMLEE